MAETLYRRCPGCDQFNPESELLCGHCGHSLDSLPSKRTANRWWIQSIVIGVLLFLLALSFFLEERPEFVNSLVTAVAQPSSSVTPSNATAIREVLPDVASKPTQTPVPEPIVLVERDMKVRSGPGTYYPIVGSAKPGDLFPIIGRNQTSDWWRIRFIGSLAWIYAPLVTTANTEDTTIDIFIPPKLSSAQIFTKVSPAIAYIQTAETSGSGVLIEGRFLVTNRHVVYPSETARVVFPSGAEFDGVPVRGWELETDLAVLGPIDISMEPVPLDRRGKHTHRRRYVPDWLPGRIRILPTADHSQRDPVASAANRFRGNHLFPDRRFHRRRTKRRRPRIGHRRSNRHQRLQYRRRKVRAGCLLSRPSTAYPAPHDRRRRPRSGQSASQSAAVHYDGGIDLLGFAT